MGITCTINMNTRTLRCIHLVVVNSVLYDVALFSVPSSDKRLNIQRKKKNLEASASE